MRWPLGRNHSMSDSPSPEASQRPALEEAAAAQHRMLRRSSVTAW
jgi:hypothetical protein